MGEGQELALPKAVPNTEPGDERLHAQAPGLPPGAESPFDSQGLPFGLAALRRLMRLPTSLLFCRLFLKLSPSTWSRSPRPIGPPP